MPPLRPLTRTFPLPSKPSSRTPVLAGLRVFSAADSQRLSVQQPTMQRSFSTTPVTNSAGHSAHESPYDPPGGWLWGIKPGEKYEKEGWERLWVWGYWGPLVLAAVAYAYKPDTSIQTWALEEARRRLEAEGILPDPDTAGQPVKDN